MRFALATWEVRDLLLIPSRQNGFWFQLKGERTRLACDSTRPRGECLSPMFATRRRKPHARARMLPIIIKRQPLSSTARRAVPVGIRPLNAIDDCCNAG
jgi:hypothetical protein